MKSTSTRWKEIAPSQFSWERAALAFVRERLPDHEPYRAWSNFEFIAADGSVNEVDLLVLSKKGFFLAQWARIPDVVGACSVMLPPDAAVSVSSWITSMAAINVSLAPRHGAAAGDTTASGVERRLATIELAEVSLLPSVTEESLEGLKFHACLPRELVHRVTSQRLGDPRGVAACLREPVRYVGLAE